MASGEELAEQRAQAVDVLARREQGGLGTGRGQHPVGAAVPEQAGTYRTGRRRSG